MRGAGCQPTFSPRRPSAGRPLGRTAGDHPAPHSAPRDWSMVRWSTRRLIMPSRQPKSAGFAVCLRNEGFTASLEVRKLYPVLTDPTAAANDLIQVIDESGEDYMYPANLFRQVSLPADLQRALRLASWTAPASTPVSSPATPPRRSRRDGRSPAACRTARTRPFRRPASL